MSVTEMSAMQTTEGVSDLRKSLEAHDRTFTKLLSLIPAKYYIMDTPEEADNKWMKNKKKRSASEVAQTRKKAKLEKFDPANQKSILEIQSERAAAAAADAEGDVTATTSSKMPLNLVPMQPSASIATLRQKLQDKIDSLRSNKKQPVAAAEDADENEEDDEMEGGTAGSRDEMMEEQRKRRGEVRDNRRRKRKEERRAEKEVNEKGKKKKVEKPKTEEELKEDKGKNKADFTTKPGKNSLIVDPLPRGQSGASASIDNSVTENVSFPSLALPSSSIHRSATHIKNISNPSQALEHLERRKAKLAELPEEKRKEIEEKERWAKAQERAEGTKVRDDEGKLKKAVKRVEKQKQKSGQAWSERKVDANKTAAIKAKKRNDNIAARGEARKNKNKGLKPKGDKERKKGGSGGGGKSRPGFEGGRAGGGGKKSSA